VEQIATNIPVPPHNELIHLLFLRGTIKEIDYSVIEALRVGDQIRSHKSGSG
jgi:hypothetical protein